MVKKGEAKSIGSCEDRTQHNETDDQIDLVDFFLIEK